MSAPGARAAGTGPARGSAWFSWALAAGTLAGAIGLFFACFERVETEVSRPPGAAAQRNRYLAVERLLERAGFQVESYSSPGELPWPPPPRATLVMPTTRTQVTTQRSEEMLQWVRQGGHLVVVTYSLWDDEFRSPDPILDPLGLRQYQHDYGDVPDEAVAQVFFEERPQGPLEVRVQPLFYWDPPSDETNLTVESAHGLHLIELAVGEGYVTALTDDIFLYNDRIGELDHAELAVRLFGLQASRERGTPLRSGMPVWFVTRDEAPSAWTLIWENTWRIALALGVLIAAWVLAVSQRFGPMLAEAGAVRRSLMEHVEASGRFLWRHGQRASLLEAEREALLERVRIRHPGWMKLPPGELHARLAQGANLAPEAVERLMRSGGQPSPESFVASVRALHRIASSL